MGFFDRIKMIFYYTHKRKAHIRSIEDITTYSDLIKSADVKESDMVLDVGCGICPYYGEGSMYELVGLDVSKEMLKNAQMTNKGTILTPIQGDAKYLPFRDNQFDAVISYNLLYLLSNPIKAVEEMTRVLKPGKGLAVVPIHETNVSYTGEIVGTLKKLGFLDVKEEKRKLYAYGTKPF